MAPALREISTVALDYEPRAYRVVLSGSASVKK